MLLASACAPLSVTPAPRGVQRIAVLPIYDAFGQGLAIRYASIVGLLEGQPAPVTVPELLERDLRGRLRAQGFEIVDPATVQAATAGRAAHSPAEAARMAREAALPGAALYGALSRWDASRGVAPDYITVALDLVLLDPATGSELWRAHWPTRPVPTGGAGSYAVAAEMASAWIVDRLTASLRPGGGEAMTRHAEPGARR
jgi:hypothetical protein